MNLPLADEYQTLGGFLIYQMQKIPVVGEQFLYNDCEMTVKTAEGPRLDKIQIRRLLPELVEEHELMEADASPRRDLEAIAQTSDHPMPKDYSESD